MIYGAYIGLAIVVCSVLKEWFSWPQTILIGTGVTLVILVVWAFRSQFTKIIFPASAVSPPTSTTTGSGTATATTPPAPPPAPAPAVRVRSYGWLWIIVGILLIIVVIWVVIPAMRPSAPAPPATSATPPKKELRQPEDKRGLSLVGGGGIFEDKGFIGVEKGGHAFFATQTMPWRRDAVFHVVVKLLQKTTGYVCIEINGGRGGTKFYMHPGSSEFATVVFFETGEQGDPGYFNPGPNQVKIWSTVGTMTIQYVSIEMLY